MRLLLNVSCSNGFDDEAASYGLLEITPQYAREVLKMMDAVAPLKELGSFYMAEFFDYSVQYGNLPAGWDENERLAELVEALEQTDMVEVPEDLEFELEPSRTDIDTIGVSPTDVLYTAAEKYSDSRLECPLMERALFEKVAGAVEA